MAFSAFWSLKTMHVLLEHHHHDSDHPVCEVSQDSVHDPGVAHIHDERWAVEDCTLCAFTVSAPEPFTLPVLQDIWVKNPEKSAPDHYVSPLFSKAAFDFNFRRGPPSCA
jgi:hypothetical protein